MLRQLSTDPQVIHKLCSGCYRCIDAKLLVDARLVNRSWSDSIHALAFQRWLEGRGWAKDDVFIDLHGIGK